MTNPFKPISWDTTVQADTQDELQDAINAASGPTKIVTGYIFLESAINVPAGKTIYIEGGEFNASGHAFGVMDVQTQAGADTTVYFGNSFIMEGTGSPMGGAIRSIGTGNALIALESGTYIANCSSVDGGAIGIQKGAVGVFNATIMDNQALGNGGAIYVGEGYGEGGAAFVMDGEFETLICQNTAGQSGGAIYIASAGYPAEIINGTIYLNTYENNGGGLYAQDLVMTGGTIMGNTAAQGGGIYMTSADETSLDIFGSVQFYDNITEGGQRDGGGAIYCARSKLWDLTVGPDVVFEANSATPGTAVIERLEIDDAVYAANIHPTVWSEESPGSPLLPQGYNNFDISYNDTLAQITVAGTKSAVNAQLPCRRFTFGLYNNAGERIGTATNHYTKLQSM